MNKIKNSHLISFFGLANAIASVFGFAFAIYCYYKNRSNICILILSFSIAIFAYAYQPSEGTDLSRWFQLIDKFSEFNLTDFMIYVAKQQDILSYLFIFILSSLDLPKQLLPFAVAFTSYYAYIKSSRDYIYKNNNETKILGFIFLLVVINLDFRTITLGVRQGMALCLLYAGICSDTIDRKKQSYLQFLSAGLIHFMTVPIILLFYLSKINIPVSSRIIALISISLYSVSSFILTGVQTILQHLPGNLFNVAEIYTIGRWGLEHESHISFFGLMHSYVLRLSIPVISVYLIINNPKDRLAKFSAIYLVLISLVEFSITLHLRYTVFLTMLSPLILMPVFFKTAQCKNKLFFSAVFTAIVFINFFAMIYSSKNELPESILTYLKFNILFALI